MLTDVLTMVDGRQSRRGSGAAGSTARRGMDRPHRAHRELDRGAARHRRMGQGGARQAQALRSITANYPMHAPYLGRHRARPRRPTDARAHSRPRASHGAPRARCGDLRRIRRRAARCGSAGGPTPRRLFTTAWHGRAPDGERRSASGSAPRTARPCGAGGARPRPPRRRRRPHLARGQRSSSPPRAAPPRRPQPSPRTPPAAPP